MRRRCLASMLALSLALCCAPLCPKAGAQTGSPGDTKTQDQTGAKPNVQPGQKKPAPSEKEIEKIMHAVFNVGVGQRITVYLRDGQTLHGTVAEIREDDFKLAEVDVRQSFTIRYDSVKKIRSGYGGVNIFTGRTTNAPPRGVRIALFSALATLLAIPIIAVITAKN
jgi:hypothetical protein